MKQYGLIGNPLSHSFSKKYFEEKFARQQISGCSYQLYELPAIEDLPNLLTGTPNLCGLNVTIPYKQAVIPYLHSLSAEAESIGAVNCIKISNGKLHGHNTDWYGFETSLKSFLQQTPQQAFILGTGGSSKAVAYVLNRLGLNYRYVSRTAGNNTISYENIQPHLQQSNLFINTTPLGMYPNTTEAPAIPYHLLSANDYLFDLIYNPTETTFMLRGKQHGAHTQNGLPMLQLQAEKSWEIWNS
jgi:shikimate dehydrogenase